MSTSKSRKVTFTKEQLHLLKKAFPPCNIDPSVNIEPIMFNAGQQSVVRFVENNTPEDRLIYG